MRSFDTELLLLAVLAAFAVWLLVTVWRYVAIQARKGVLEQEQNILGRSGRAEYRGFMAVVVPRVPSTLAFVAVLVIVLALGLAKAVGYI